MAGLLFQGAVSPPWEEQTVSEPDPDGLVEPDQPPQRVDLEWRKFWAKALELGVFEHTYLLTTHTNLTRSEVLDLPTQDRVMWVARLLRDQDLDDKRYNNLIKVMVDLWSVKQ